MDKPGLQRAIPYMILAFVASLIFVYAVRSLQNMDPVWVNADTSEGAQVGLVLAAFASMGAFMWGIGAFDPKMSEHGDHADEAHEETAPEKEFSLNTSGWFFYLGQIQYKFGISLLALNPLTPPFPLPDNGNVLSMAIGYFLWFPLYVVLMIFSFITRFVAAIATMSFKPVGWTGNFVLNGLLNLIWGPVWFFLLYAPSRFTMGAIAGLWITLGIPIMAISWIGQLIRFYVGQVFLIMTISVVLIIGLFAFALLPHGLRLQTTTEPNADVAANGFGVFVVPVQDILGLVLPPENFSNTPIEGTSQFAVFLGFIVIVFVSLGVASGLIAIFFYLSHRGVKEVTELETTDKDRTQILPIREVGSIAGGVANVIRAIPEAIGYKK